MTISIIVAMGYGNEIGLAGDMPWGHSLPDDLTHFRTLTTGHTVVMGRRTFESFGRALPHRRNLVVTSRPLEATGIEIVTNVEQLFNDYSRADDECWVIGGAQLYAMALPQAQKLELTRVQGFFEADTYFPEIDWTSWTKVSDDMRYKHVSPNLYSLQFESWRRVSAQVGQLYNMSAARTNEQLEQMQDLEAAGDCHFCRLPTRQEPIIDGEHWYVVKNQFPYTHTRLHLLIVPRKHHVTLATLSELEQREYLSLLIEIERRFQLDAYAQFMRVGVMEATGATIAHLHGHVVVGDRDAPDFEPIRVKLAT